MGAEFPACMAVVGQLFENTGNLYKYVGAVGYYADPSSGVMLLGARYYNPSVGRFMTLDPIKDGKNWYGYVENRPTVAVDPNGEWAIVCIIVAGAMVAVMVFESIAPFLGGKPHKQPPHMEPDIPNRCDNLKREPNPWPPPGRGRTPRR